MPQQSDAAGMKQDWTPRKRDRSTKGDIKRGEPPNTTRRRDKERAACAREAEGAAVQEAQHHKQAHKQGPTNGPNNPTTPKQGTDKKTTPDPLGPVETRSRERLTIPLPPATQ
eukprot:scaffold79687_cov32-Tisochrysis_lutea.AAC.1